MDTAPSDHGRWNRSSAHASQGHASGCSILLKPDESHRILMVFLEEEADIYPPADNQREERVCGLRGRRRPAVCVRVHLHQRFPGRGRDRRDVHHLTLGNAASGHRARCWHEHPRRCPGGERGRFHALQPHRGDRAFTDHCGAPRRARHCERLEPRYLVARPAILFDPRPHRRPHRGRRGRNWARLGQLGAGCPHGSCTRARGRGKGPRFARSIGRDRPGWRLCGPTGSGRPVEKLPTTRGAAADHRCELGGGPRYGLLQRGERCAETDLESLHSYSSPQARRRRSRCRYGLGLPPPCSSGSEPLVVDGES